EVGSSFMRLRRVGGVEHNLHRAPAVAQVNEDQPAVVAAACDPAVKLAVVARAKRSAVRSVEAAHASRVGNSVHASSSCTPLVMSRICATRRSASSGVSKTTHLAPTLFADFIFARRLLG